MGTQDTSTRESTAPGIPGIDAEVRRKVDRQSMERNPTGPPIASTRASRAWVRVLPLVAVLAVTLIFVLQNRRTARISFLSVSGDVPLAVALLAAAALGALVVLALGSVRIVQLRRVIHRQLRDRPSSSSVGSP